MIPIALGLLVTISFLIKNLKQFWVFCGCQVYLLQMKIQFLSPWVTKVEMLNNPFHVSACSVFQNKYITVSLNCYHISYYCSRSLLKASSNISYFLNNHRRLCLLDENQIQITPLVLLQQLPGFESKPKINYKNFFRSEMLRDAL